MVVQETIGDSDFRSIYSSVDREYREAEEQKQLKNFLNLLDELDNDLQHNEKHRKRKRRSRRTKELMTLEPQPEEEEDEESLFDDTEAVHDYEHEDDTCMRKENLRVSIVDDEGAKKENEEEKETRAKKNKKVYTLDDLPKDDLNLFSFFPEPEPKPSDLSISGGRRLSDGKITYTAGFPSLNDTLKIGELSLDLDYIVLFLLVVFISGFFIGKIINSLNSRRVLNTTMRKMNERLRKSEEVIQRQTKYIMDQNMYIMSLNNARLNGITAQTSPAQTVHVQPNAYTY